MGMLLRSHFVQPLCFRVEESEACVRVKRTFPMSHRQTEVELELEIHFPDSSLVSFLVTL